VRLGDIVLRNRLGHLVQHCSGLGGQLGVLRMSPIAMLVPLEAVRAVTTPHG